MRLLDEGGGLGQHLGEGVAEHDGVLALAVLDHVVGQVEEVQPVRKSR